MSEKQAHTISYNKGRIKNLPFFWKALIAVTIVLILNYSSEIFLYSFVVPKDDIKDFYPNLGHLMKSVLRMFLSHLSVITILILLLEIPRKRIWIRWWHLIFLVIVCYPASMAVYVIAITIRDGFQATLSEDFSIYSGIALFPSVIMAMLVYGLMLLWDNAQREHDNALKAKALVSEAKWQMLRYQVNPHFLFNSLTSIMALINSDKELARSIVNELSNYFRYTLSLNNLTVVILSQELEASEHFLKIQKVRFSDRLDYKIDMGEGTGDIGIPVFGVQTLVENAIKYGLKTKKGRVEVFIVSKLEGDYYLISVVNSGKIYNETGNEDDSKVFGTNSGLQNLVERLNLLYPGESSFELREEEANRVIAEIKIKKNSKPRI